MRKMSSVIYPPQSFWKPGILMVGIANNTNFIHPLIFVLSYSILSASINEKKVIDKNLKGLNANGKIDVFIGLKTVIVLS